MPGSGGRAGTSGQLRRDREYWLGFLGRPALLVVWAGVFWGTLVAFSLVFRAMEVGLGETLARLRKLRRPLPPGFVFDREEADAR